MMQKLKSEMAFGRIPAYCKYELFMERYRSAAEVIRRERSLNGSTKFLDVGCGEGYMKAFFDPEEGNWHGIECWSERADLCRKLGYQVVDIDINRDPFPYPDECFDVVLASHVIEHLADIDFCLGEMARVLKRGGLMLLATPTKPPGVALMIGWLHRMQHKRRGETQQAFSVVSLKNRVEKALDGYDLIDARGFRLLSMRKHFSLENLRSFYRINTFLGKHLTFLVPEVNLLYRKNA